MRYQYSDNSEVINRAAIMVGLFTLVWVARGSLTRYLTHEIYKEATPTVRDINEDGRADISLVSKDGKVLQTYLQPENGFDAGKENSSELEKKVILSEEK